MNISGLIRSLVGDLQAADSKVLELKVGQVVKGVVLQLLSDQEAMLNIGGVQVRAKLETPLKQGDVTMLQVQPESSGGQILLKPLVSSDVQIADESMNELLKAFSLKDNAGNRQLVQQIQQEGVPLTKETAQTFASVLSQMPEGANKEEWVQAAVLAYKRGLPLTQETVAAIKQTTAGTPAGQVLGNVLEQAETLLQQQPDHPAADTLKQVVSLLRELRDSSAVALTGRPPQQAAAPAPAQPAAAQAGAEPPAASAAPPSAGGPAPQAAEKPAAAAPQAAAASPASAAPRAEAPAAGLAQPPAGEPAQARSAEPAVGGEPPVAGSPVKPPPAEPKAAARPAAQQPEAAPVSEEADTQPNWISRMLKAVGVEHEHHLAKLDDRPDSQPLLRPRDQSDDQPGLLVRSEPQSGLEKPASAETLKSLLLQLTASDDTPAPLKEAAQQAVQQITGQQLLLTSDKTSMFAHLTLFIPFIDGSGQQSAAVHIQSRKGRRGEVDANNCRLLFDLQMKSLGSTLVDVQVVNKIVSLHIHNDQPAVAALIEGNREEISASLNKAGYQFLSLKVSPFPELPTAKDGEVKLSGQADAAKIDLRSLYQPKAYKGVDYRA